MRANPTGAAPTRLEFPRRAWIVVAVGVGLRLLWATVGVRQQKILADPLIYWQAAQRIAQGDGYVSFNGHPTSYFPPGYPWFLGVLQWFLNLVGLDDSLIGATAIVQALLSGVAIAAVVVAGVRLGGTRVGLAAGLVMALWPNLIVHSSLMLSETLFITFLSLSIAGLVTMYQDERLILWRAVVAGTAMGAATLVRPQVLVVAVAAVLAWAVSRLDWRDVLRRTAILGVGVLVVVAPWTIRNAMVFDAFVPVSTNDGDNLCVGFNPEATGHFGIPDDCDTGEFYIDGTGAELRRQRETRERAIDYVFEHPGEQPELAWKKLYYTFRNDTDGLWALSSFGQDQWLSPTQRALTEWPSNGYFVVVMLGSVAGAVLAIRRFLRDDRLDPTGPLVVIGAVVSALIPIAFFGDARFKVPGAPLFALLAGLAAATLWSHWRGPEAAPNPSDAEHPAPAEPTGQQLHEEPR